MSSARSDARIVADWRGKLAARKLLLKSAERSVRWWAKRAGDPHGKGRLDQAVARRARRRRQVAEAEAVVKRHAPKPTLALRAYKVAEGLVGVMEVGGNNRGARVEAIIHANGGAGPEAWCGDFMAYCYRLAGSTRVVRSWAAVRLIRGLLGIRATSSPTRGNLVRFTFDHVGMFDHWCDARGNATTQSAATHIKTIEGNTGASGAASDSATGGDGVYRKVRHKSLVRDYLHVTG